MFVHIRGCVKAGCFLNMVYRHDDIRDWSFTMEKWGGKKSELSPKIF